jgi:hypothetical protein
LVAEEEEGNAGGGDEQEHGESDGHSDAATALLGLRR